MIYVVFMVLYVWVGARVLRQGAHYQIPWWLSAGVLVGPWILWLSEGLALAVWAASFVMILRQVRR